MVLSLSLLLVEKRNSPFWGKKHSKFIVITAQIILYCTVYMFMNSSKFFKKGQNVVCTSSKTFFLKNNFLNGERYPKNAKTPNFLRMDPYTVKKTFFFLNMHCYIFWENNSIVFLMLWNKTRFQKNSSDLKVWTPCKAIISWFTVIVDLLSHFLTFVVQFSLRTPHLSNPPDVPGLQPSPGYSIWIFKLFFYFFLYWSQIENYFTVL